jgi:hypothetical protein
VEGVAWVPPERTRSRSVLRLPSPFALPCPLLQEVQPCAHEEGARPGTAVGGGVVAGKRAPPPPSAQPSPPRPWLPRCPVDCALAPVWGSWGACSARCAGGTQERKRRVLHRAAHGGKPCPDSALGGTGTLVAAERQWGGGGSFAAAHWLTAERSCNVEPCAGDAAVGSLPCGGVTPAADHGGGHEWKGGGRGGRDGPFALLWTLRRVGAPAAGAGGAAAREAAGGGGARGEAGSGAAAGGGRAAPSHVLEARVPTGHCSFSGNSTASERAASAVLPFIAASITLRHPPLAAVQGEGGGLWGSSA